MTLLKDWIGLSSVFTRDSIMI